VDLGPIELRLVHLCNGLFGVVDVFVHDVRGASIDIDYWY
jgi:hypothetical protein